MTPPSSLSQELKKYSFLSSGSKAVKQRMNPVKAISGNTLIPFVSQSLNRINALIKMPFLQTLVIVCGVVFVTVMAFQEDACQSDI